MSNNISISDSAPRGFPKARMNPVSNNTPLLSLINSPIKNAMLKGQSTSQVNAAIQNSVNAFTQSFSQLFNGIASVIKNKNNDESNNRETSLAQNNNQDTRDDRLAMFPNYNT
jgi:hypothetical protein